MTAMAPRPADEEQELSFEEAMARLERAVLRLEGGELSLEEALATFEEGVRMARLCGRRLEQAEARLQLLLEQEGGRLAAVPWEAGLAAASPSDADEASSGDGASGPAGPVAAGGAGGPSVR